MKRPHVRRGLRQAIRSGSCGRKPHGAASMCVTFENGSLMQVVYEDNHIIIVNKRAGEIVQGDHTGDRTLADDVKAYIKERYAKPGAVFLGVVHRLDRPAQGLVMFARTSKALSRLNGMLRREGTVQKTYWAITACRPGNDEGHIEQYLTRNAKNNKTFVSREGAEGAKRAALDYRLIASSDRYFLLEVSLITGRHHQIRCQLAAMGCPVKGDLKYGAPRSNPDGSIGLLAYRLKFEHPVTHAQIDAVAPVPDDKLWRVLSLCVKGGTDGRS